MTLPYSGCLTHARLSPPDGWLRTTANSTQVTGLGNLDIFWLKDEALEESASLPAPEVIAADITADL